jgi:Rad3-related DNA helicase
LLYNYAERLKKMSILNHVPERYTLRPEQEEILLQVERFWKANDVLVIPGKVGTGKSVIAVTIARWRAARGETNAIVTPRVSLQNQYIKSFPTVPFLKGKSRYPCQDGKWSCADQFEVEDRYCDSCVFKQTKAAVGNAKVAGFNIHSYYLNKDFRNNLILDEAHMVYDFLSDHFTLLLWKHKDKYPDELLQAGDVAMWLEGEIADLDKKIIRIQTKIKKLRKAEELDEEGITDNSAEIFRLRERSVKHGTKRKRYAKVCKGLSEAPANFFIEKTEEAYRGKKMEGLRIRPAVLRGLTPILWPEKYTQKIILMSGTLSTVDLRRLALKDKRIKWISCPNPIEAKQRPVDASWGVNMSYKYQAENVPKLCKKIEELSEKHQRNGIVHATYALADKMKKHLNGDRYIWHDSENREEKLEEFKATEGAILIACGMSEGIDLAGRQFDWQIIAKVLYPNKSDLLIDKWYREDMDWILWMTVRTLLQQTGRIVRSPDDYGITYILDGAFGNPVKKRWGLWTKASKFIPEDYKESIKWR